MRESYGRSSTLCTQEKNNRIELQIKWEGFEFFSNNTSRYGDTFLGQTLLALIEFGSALLASE